MYSSNGLTWTIRSITSIDWNNIIFNSR
jgi:hypothetical protein